MPAVSTPADRRSASPKSFLWLGALLFALALPRIARAVAGVHVPDASLAVPFALGMLGFGPRYLALGLLVLMGLDATALGLGFGGACITAAYPLRYLAFATLFELGRRSATHPWPVQATALLLGTVVACSLRSGGYYFTSADISDASLAGFLVRLPERLPAYLMAAFGYWLPLAVAAASARLLPSAQPARAE